MDATDRLIRLGSRLPRPVARTLEKVIFRMPPVRRRLEREYTTMLAALEAELKPYAGQTPGFHMLPTQGLDEDEILATMQRLAEQETAPWKEGRVSGVVYHGDPDHAAFIHRVYALSSQTNPLHADLWPSIVKYEAEIVAMTAHMLGAAAARNVDPQAEVCGTLTSGGTESILMAMKTYRDWARATKGIRKPEIVAPVTAHPAFDKAGHYFGIKVIRTPVGDNFQADVQAMERAIGRNTIALVGSAPGYPHGIIDPIPAMSALAQIAGIGLHVDACLGGFVLPWAERLGYSVPPFDFRLPGVTSISVDTHKYGYAAKGTSVILYRNPALRRYQYFTATDWPGGLYASPSMAGSRPGALVAICWAVMVKMGEQGYLEASRHILRAGEAVKAGIREIPELRILGDPLWIIAFTSDQVDIYRVLDAMARRGWRLSGLQHPPAIHIALTLRHTQPGVVDRFLQDLRDVVAEVKTQPPAEGGMAPIYGMAASLPFRGLIDELLRRYLDLLYKL